MPRPRFVEASSDSESSEITENEPANTQNSVTEIAFGIARAEAIRRAQFQAIALQQTQTGDLPFQRADFESRSGLEPESHIQSQLVDLDGSAAGADRADVQRYLENFCQRHEISPIGPNEIWDNEFRQRILSLLPLLIPDYIRPFLRYIQHGGLFLSSRNGVYPTSNLRETSSRLMRFRRIASMAAVSVDQSPDQVPSDDMGTNAPPQFSTEGVRMPLVRSIYI